MPIYNPDHVEYHVTSGHIQIAMEDGTNLPAYWAHPNMGAKFSGIVLIHDWWGVTPLIRLMTSLLAQVGHYVIVPDFYQGKVAQTHNEALKLLDALGDTAYKRADTALSVLEHHRNCNGDVAIVGLGMGGSLAFEAAIVRPDLEAAVAYGGFPQRYIGHFKRANAPILAIYGAHDQYIDSKMIAQLKQELAAAPLKDQHEVVVLENSKHDIFSDDTPELTRLAAWHKTLDFLDDLLEGPSHPAKRKKY
jgi:carboxymethylenebutenolidase